MIWINPLCGLSENCVISAVQLQINYHSLVRVQPSRYFNMHFVFTFLPKKNHLKRKIILLKKLASAMAPSLGHYAITVLMRDASQTTKRDTCVFKKGVKHSDLSVLIDWKVFQHLLCKQIIITMFITRRQHNCKPNYIP